MVQNGQGSTNMYTIKNRLFTIENNTDEDEIDFVLLLIKQFKYFNLQSETFMRITRKY